MTLIVTDVANVPQREATGKDPALHLSQILVSITRSKANTALPIVISEKKKNQNKQTKKQPQNNNAHILASETELK